MKIYVTGSVGSGKTTYARKLSARAGIPCTSLDEVVYVRDKYARNGDRKRPVQERDAIFSQVMAQDSWIMEDAGRACFAQGMEEADCILVLDYPLRLRQRRIVKRWVRQKLGLEVCLYRPSLWMLRAMLRWAKGYDTGRDGLRERLARCDHKVMRFKRPQQAEAYLRAWQDKDGNRG